MNENPNLAQTPPGRGMKAGLPLWPFALLLLLAGGGLGAWWYLKQAEPPPSDFPELVEPVAPPAPAAQPSPPALPSLLETDPLVRTRLGALSSNPALAKWLEATDLLRRFASATYAVANGDSPRQSLGFLAPDGTFKAIEKKRQVTVDPASYRRYDLVAGVIAGVDAGAVAAAYGELERYLDAAHAEIAPPGTAFRSTLGKAVGRLTRAPLPPERAELVVEGAAFKFADPTLEELSAAEKHLVRMGPQNMARVQAKLREIAAALQLPPE